MKAPVYQTDNILADSDYLIGMKQGQPVAIPNTDRLVLGAGAGITTGTGTIYANSVTRRGLMIVTQILIDLTGLNSKNTDLDIIGKNGTALPCHIGQFTKERCGTILSGTMTCLEVPTGGDPNIDLYSADEGTGVEDGLITDLTADTALLTAGTDWTLALTRALTAFPADEQYLYLVQGDATGTDATYTAGKFLIELHGYEA